MKTHTFRKNFFQEIKHSKARFLSILFIVALGTAFFSGIRATEPDMRKSIDVFMKNHDYMDVRVISTLGLTDDDLEVLAGTEGVTRAEGGYSAYVLYEHGDRTDALEIMSLSETMNVMTVTEGRLPEAPQECLLDTFLAEEAELGIGDSIRVISGTEDDLADTLAEDTFTVTGIGNYPGYLTEQRGRTNIGSGSLAGFLAVPKEAFSQDFYSSVFIRTDDLNNYETYDDAYQDGVEAVKDRISLLEKERCEIRLDELSVDLRDGEDELADAIAELEDAEKEAADGEQELIDARKELEDGRAELADARKQLADARSEIRSGRSQLKSAKVKLQNGKSELAKGKKELADQKTSAYKKLEESKKELEDGEAKLAEGFKEYEENKAKLDAAMKEIEANEAAMAEGRKQLDAGWASYNEGAAESEASKAQLDALAAQLEQMAAMGMEETEEYQALAAQYAAGMEQWTAGAAALEAAKAELNTQEAAWQAGSKQLAEGRAEAEAGLKQLEEGYQTLLESEKQLKEGRKQLEEGYAEADKEFTAAEKKLADAESEIKSGEAEIVKNEKKLADGEAEIRKNEKKVADGEAEIADGEAEIEDGEAELEDARVKIADGWQEVADARAELDDGWKEFNDLGDGEWYVLDRRDNQTYAEFDADADKIGAIGRVFPLMFFLVAALVSLTGMTRMVEEQRSQIGLFEAMGYSKHTILGKFVWYAILATAIGSIAGVLFGEKFLPWFIIFAYETMYRFIGVIAVPYNIPQAAMGAGLAVGCNLLATVMACSHLMKSAPAQLMRPVAPKAGSKIFLERIPVLWNRLTFSWKATLRNLFRYKKRLFMTIFGTGGCTALILVGFGVKDSVTAILDNQYYTLWTFDGSCAVDPDASERELETLDAWLTEDARISAWLDVYEEDVDVSIGDSRSREVTLIVPSDPEAMQDFIHLRDRVSHEAYTLEDDTVVITEKLARLLGLSVGDSLDLHPDEGEKITATVGAITENYMLHYVYMAPALYQELTGEAAVSNVKFLQFDLGLEESEGILGSSASEEAQRAAAVEAISTELLKQKAVLSVELTEDSMHLLDSMMANLMLIVAILTTSAGLLAFVVIFNLNNISITERRRELATLKVLGFYDGEVSAYVYRENILLTILGIALGMGLGILMHHSIMTTVETESIMFGRDLAPMSYIAGIVLTFLFSVIVNGLSFFSLRRIDMIESLKSVE